MTRENEALFDGVNWPTHSVAVWIANDSRFYDTACNYAKLDDTGESLQRYLARLLFERETLAEEERRRLTRDSVRLLDDVASGLTSDGDTLTPRQAFNAINWKHVRFGLVG